MTRPSATIVIPTYNGEKYLGEILDRVLIQKGVGEFDVLVIDSGSTDTTMEIVARYPTVRLHQIPNAEFGHGKTRNLAAQLATGEIVVYLTHDAIPADEQWLAYLLEPFAISPRVVAVMGKQIPRPGSFPLLKYDILGVFAGQGPDNAVTLYVGTDADAEADIAGKGFYSDVNSAARRSILLGEIPYRDVPYAEDQLFGRDVVTAGLIKAYAPRAAVVHSNDLTLAEFGRRIIDETIGLRRIGFAQPPMSRGQQLRLTLRGVAGDTRRILSDGSYSWRRKLYWIVVNPLFQCQKWRSLRRATHLDLDDQASIERFSLEHSRK